MIRGGCEEGSVGGDQLHIGGERAAAFRELVDDLDPRRVLLVGIDVAKASWLCSAATCNSHIDVPTDAKASSRHNG